MTEYSVKRTNKRVYSNCEKHRFKIVDKNTDENIVEEVLSFSHWQLEDKEQYKRRVREWASKTVSGDHRFDVSNL